MTEMTEERLAEAVRILGRCLRVGKVFITGQPELHVLHREAKRARESERRLRAELAAMTAENERLRSMVWEFGDHKVKCPRFRSPRADCNCGFAEFNPEPQA